MSVENNVGNKVDENSVDEAKVNDSGVKKPDAESSIEKLVQEKLEEALKPIKGKLNESYRLETKP